MIFVYVCLTFRVVDLNTRFETWRARNEINGLYSFHLHLKCANIAHISCTWIEYTPFTSFLAINVSNRVLSSTNLNVEQTYKNIIIWRESSFQPLFSTNNLHRPIKHKILHSDNYCPLWAQVSLMTSDKAVIKSDRTCHTSKNYWPQLIWLSSANTRI
jgi:hypothetical protein